jgi:hypothetical protein
MGEVVQREAAKMNRPLPQLLSQTTDAVAAAVAEHLLAAANLIAAQNGPPAAETLKMSEPFVNLKWMLIPLFCSLTGYSDKAIRRKIETGVWLQGKHYRKAPDGRITMNLQEYYDWVESA